MDIQKVSQDDLESITHLVLDVAKIDVFPHFNEKGQAEFKTRVLPDLNTILTEPNYLSVKAAISGEIVGVAALRNADYLTHLFVSKSCQGKGIGKALLNYLVTETKAQQVSLRSSINAVSFYESLGFECTAEEGDYNGIRFVPMTLDLQNSRNIKTG
ncbi:GNAT family N-acetyltransferase [Litoribrevibacter albus]|uniref:N-acetyltransferase n=1 Tax=Litoribrevibacter albus TaxID=1473156 RepID=A0AA37W6I7_9GAMM|nr:GNAT family N-acetyltransferase [Litoribrevibacter albus]GLQ29969.1 N-acetyltransferase [Litoribrevibacter albus]